MTIGSFLPKSPELWSRRFGGFNYRPLIFPSSGDLGKKHPWVILRGSLLQNWRVEAKKKWAANFSKYRAGLVYINIKLHYFAIVHTPKMTLWHGTTFVGRIGPTRGWSTPTPTWRSHFGTCPTQTFTSSAISGAPSPDKYRKNRWSDLQDFSNN